MDTTDIANAAFLSEDHKAAAMRSIHAALARASMEVPPAEEVCVDIVDAQYDPASEGFTFEFDMKNGWSSHLVLEEYTVEEFRNSQAIATNIVDSVFVAVQENLFAATILYSK